MTTYDHNIDVVQVETPAGWMTVKEACELIGSGPGYKEGYPIYNTIQCGHGPLNDAGDEHNCPGTERVMYKSRLVNRSHSSVRNLTLPLRSFSVSAAVKVEWTTNFKVVAT